MKTLSGKSFGAVACGFAFALTVLSAPNARAQTPAPAPQQKEETAATQSAPAQNDADGLLSQLNLTPEQITQMREIQAQSFSEARALTRRLNQARRALDEAIYADAVDETLIEQRARDVAEAQVALVRLRARTELRVRRVLTLEQLQTFRDLRQQAQRQRQLQRRLNRGQNPQRPGQNSLDNPNRQNQRPNANQTPNDARPLPRLRERRKP